MHAPMLLDDIKKKAAAAVKTGDTVARDVLRLALGEIQTAEARRNAPLSDEEAMQSVRKLVKANEETLAAIGDGDPRAVNLRHELEVLRSVLPAKLSPEQIADKLADQRDAIRAANNDGQATGIAMKHLKSIGAQVEGNDVAAATKQMRG